MTPRSVSFRLLVLSLLGIALLIPGLMVTSLVGERHARQIGAVDDITSKWGAAQTIAGPVLSVPYQVHRRNEKGFDVTTTEYAEFLPETLVIDGQATTETRYRGIYEANLYKSDLDLHGSFKAIDWNAWGIAPQDVLWNEAIISLGITDMHGIRDTLVFRWNGRDLPMNPGIPRSQILTSGAHARIAMPGGFETSEFRVTLRLNGSQHLLFMPFGKVTTATLASPWKNPSFFGAFLPVDRRISEQGFKASWKVLHINRNFPQEWRSGQRVNVTDAPFGVQFLPAVDPYLKTERSTKYAVLFILYAFGTFFCTELLLKRSAHPLQYLLIGLAVILFYSVLLSLAEQIGFGAAYLISSVLIVAMISAYAQGLFGRRRSTIGVAAALGGLYAYLYVLLQIADYALLAGNAGLLLALGAAMYVTRKTELLEGA